MRRDEIKHIYHAVCQVNYHFGWRPARRKKVLMGDVAKRLHELCQEVAVERDWAILNLAIQPEHINLFVEARPNEAPHEIVRAFKGRCSRILRQEFSHLLRCPFLWPQAYFCSAAGKVSAVIIAQYLKGQLG